MGAWGYRSFENDDAADWVDTVTNGRSLAPVTEALATAISADYLEAPTASEALAAAEIVAAIHRKPSPVLPEAVANWIQSNRPALGSDHRSQAQAAVRRVLEESELQELWAEGDESEAWQADVRDLLNRLS